MWCSGLSSDWGHILKVESTPSAVGFRERSKGQPDFWSKQL